MRWKGATLAAFCIITSCTEPPNSKPVSMENEQLVKQYFEYFNNHQWKEMAELYTERAEFKDPSLGNGVVPQTRAQIIEKYAGMKNTFPDIHDELVQVYPSGDRHVIVEFISKGTAPDGSKFELPICTIFTIENGKITKDYTYYDNFEEAGEEPK